MLQGGDLPVTPRPRKYPKELIDRGVRLAIESGRPVAHVALDVGLPSETLRKAVRQAEADQGLRPDLPSTEEREEIRKLRQEVFDVQMPELVRAGDLEVAGTLAPTLRADGLQQPVLAHEALHPLAVHRPALP